MGTPEDIEQPQFVVLRFFPTEEDDNEYFEVGLASWLMGELDDDMVGVSKWPPKHRPATCLVKSQCPPDRNWDEHKVQVMRFYDTFVKARAAVPRFIADSHYETEAPSGPQKKRRRVRPNRFDTSSDEEIPVRKTTNTIPAPPSVQITGPKTVRKGQGLTKPEQKKKEREELMERLKAARAAVTSRMQSPVRPRKSPSKSPWKITPRKGSATSEQTESLGIHFLVDDETIEDPAQMDSCHTTPLNSPVGSPVKLLPTFTSFSQLPADTSFYLSPASAQAVSKDFSRAASGGALASNGTAFNEVLAGTSNESPIEGPSASKNGSSPKILKSSVDGRRRLFAVQEKSISERLEAIEASLLSLEVMIRENSAKTDVVLMNLGRLQRSLLPNEKRICKPHGMPKLPLATQEELKKFEDFLADSDANLAGACDYLSSYVKTLVPDPERASARAILAKLLYNSLAKKMNLNGGNGKIGIRSLHIYQVFLGTLQSTFKDSDLSEAQDALQKWLKDAKWRKQITSSKAVTSPPSPSKQRSSAKSRSKD